MMATQSHETRSSRPSPLHSHPSLDPKAPSEAEMQAARRRCVKGRNVGSFISVVALFVVCTLASWQGFTTFAHVQEVAISAQTAEMKSLRAEIERDASDTVAKSQGLERKLIAENMASRSAAASSIISEPVRSAPEPTFVASNR